MRPNSPAPAAVAPEFDLGFGPEESSRPARRGKGKLLTVKQTAARDRMVAALARLLAIR